MVYIDSDYKCHTDMAEDRRPVEIGYFDDKCKTFVEGYRYVPAGESWTRADGVPFTGEMLAPWRDEGLLAAAQGAYADARRTIAELDAAVIDLTYQNILLEMGVNE